MQICVLEACGILQAWDIRSILVRRELAAASYFLGQEVLPEVVAAVWNNREVTEEGAELLEMIGHTEHTPGYLLLLTEQSTVPMILVLVTAGSRRDSQKHINQRCRNSLLVWRAEENPRLRSMTEQNLRRSDLPPQRRGRWGRLLRFNIKMLLHKKRLPGNGNLLYYKLDSLSYELY